MTRVQFAEKAPIDHLRLLVRNFDLVVPQEFAQGFTFEELWKLHRAWMLSGWDIPPHEWTPRQVKEALSRKPRIPRWDDASQLPLYPGERI